SPGNDTEGSVEAFICEEVRRATSRALQPEELHSILRDNPSLLILDGLDEVTDANLRKRLLSEIDDFVDRADRTLHANMQVFATTRPTGYNNQFNSMHYLHLRLVGLEPTQVREYVRRWAIARSLEHAKADRLQSGIEECLSDHQVRLLTKTPLQVTILVLIISTGGTPPRQREALFDEYLEVIYKREQAKSRSILTSKKEMLIGLHKYVGYELHERATRPHETGAELDREEYTQRVDLFLRKHDPYSPDEERRADIASITTEAGERLVLIVEPTADRFGFELRSIQEFFAALHICDTARDTQERYRRFEALVRLPHWRNVLLFFAGRVGRNFPGEASNVVEVCRQVDREGLDMHLRRGAFLALAIANDQAFLPNRRMQRSVIEVALQLLEVRHTPDQTMEIIDALASLPDEDVRDHVIPLLRERATLLAPEHATSILKSLALLNPVSAEALELLRKIAMLATCRVECFGAAVQVAVVQTPAIEIARNLACAMDPAELRGALDTNVWLHPRTVLTTVGNGASNETLSKLIRAVGPHLMQPVPPATVENSETWNEYCTSPSPTSSIEALCDVLHALGVIRTIHMRSYRNSDADAETLEKLEAVQAILPRAAVDGDIDDLIARTLQGAEGAFAAPYWALHLLVGRVSDASLERFHEFYASHWNDPFVRSSMSGGFDGTAILDYIGAKWRADLDESWESIDSVLLEFGGLNGFKRWRELQVNLEGIQYSLLPREGRKNFRSTTSMLEFEPIKEALSGFVDRFDRDLVDILLRGARRARGFAGHRPSETDELLESVTNSRVITNMKRNQIRELCARGNVDARSSEARIQVLDHLVALRSDTRAASLLLSVLGSAVSTGLMSDEQIKQHLADISTLCDKSLMQLGFLWPQSKALYSTLVPIAAQELDTPARRGAAKLLVHSGISRSHTMMNQAPMTYRFAGFAGFQAKLALSNDSLIRAAGTATFFVRRSVGRNAEDSLRTLIRACCSDVEERLITALCDYDMQLADRWKTWRNVIEPLLSEELFGGLKPFLTERMSSLLESENQSLQSVEEELNLPLGRLYGT
ncbi:MAG: NACHT domain-containing protein, partial [Gammaproteobacteria bacterium]